MSAYEKEPIKAPAITTAAILRFMCISVLVLVTSFSTGANDQDRPEH